MLNPLPSVASSEVIQVMTERFDQMVKPHLSIPADEIDAYAARLTEAFSVANVEITKPQYVVLVDRNPRVQVAFVYFGSSTEPWHLIGATPVSTGLPGQFEHFVTPLGVFDHSLLNPDFRAEGTKNENGFRGYGIKGMRVFDFGWVNAPKTWGNHAMSEMRLQMHATDPDLAEPLLGQAKSKGCVRIPATLNDFIDRFGLLDADYSKALAEGKNLWVLRKDRVLVASPGRYLVIVDSQSTARPQWARPRSSH